MPDNLRNAEFLAAIELFNTQEFFACHDALEEIWSETLGEQRNFLQGLIHAAVSLFHFSEGNLGGARKMHDSTLRYLEGFGDIYANLELGRFRNDYRECFAPLLGEHSTYPTGAELNPDLIPQLHFREIVDDELA